MDVSISSIASSFVFSPAGNRPGPSPPPLPPSVPRGENAYPFESFRLSFIANEPIPTTGLPTPRHPPSSVHTVEILPFLRNFRYNYTRLREEVVLSSSPPLEKSKERALVRKSKQFVNQGLQSDERKESWPRWGQSSDNDASIGCRVARFACSRQHV